MDVIALHNVGITNAVAPLGTAVTADHLKLMWKIAPEPTICLDGDEAGKRAMSRIAIASLPLLKPDHSLQFAILPKGKDPDDVIKYSGVDTMRGILSSAKPLSETIWNIATTKNSATPEQKAGLEKKIMKMVESIKDKSVQNYYRKHFSSKLWEKNYPTKKGKAQNKKEIFSTELNAVSYINHSQIEKYSATLITIVLNYPELLNEFDIEEEFATIELSSKNLEELRSAILEITLSNPGIKAGELQHELSNKGFNKQIDDLINNKFIGNITPSNADDNIAKYGWNYMIICHNLSAVELEYEKALETMSNSNPDSVWELKKQTDTLRKEVEKEKILYENALGD